MRRCKRGGAKSSVKRPEWGCGISIVAIPNAITVVKPETVIRLKSREDVEVGLEIKGKGEAEEEVIDIFIDEEFRTVLPEPRPEEVAELESRSVAMAPPETPWSCGRPSAAWCWSTAITGWRFVAAKACHSGSKSVISSRATR